MKKLSVKLKIFLTIVLVAVLLISSAFVVNVVKNEKHKNYSQASVVDGSGTELVSGKVYSMPKSMTFSNTSAYSVNAQDGITIKATVKPDSLKNKAVSWSLAWVNAESDFAKDKDVSDYVELTPNSENNTATIKCLSPFSEKINLTATSIFDTSKSATCVIDYAKRVSGINLNLSYAPIGGEFSDRSIFVNDYYSFVWNFNLLYKDVSFNGFSVVYGDEGTIVPVNSKVTYGRFFDYIYSDIIEDYLNGLSVINGVAIEEGSAHYYFAENNDGVWTGNLLDNVYICGYSAEDYEEVIEPLTNHVELLDLLVEKYKDLEGDYSFISLSVYVVDEYNTYSYSIDFYLSEEALESTYSVEVSLDNEGLVL